MEKRTINGWMYVCLCVRACGVGAPASAHSIKQDIQHDYACWLYGVASSFTRLTSPKSKECDLLIYFDQVIKILRASKLVAKIKFLQASKIAAAKRSLLIWFATAAATTAFVVVVVVSFAKHSFVSVISTEQWSTRAVCYIKEPVHSFSSSPMLPWRFSFQRHQMDFSTEWMLANLLDRHWVKDWLDSRISLRRMFFCCALFLAYKILSR